MHLVTSRAGVNRRTMCTPYRVILLVDCVGRNESVVMCLDVFTRMGVDDLPGRPNVDVNAVAIHLGSGA